MTRNIDLEKKWLARLLEKIIIPLIILFRYQPISPLLKNVFTIETHHNESLFDIIDHLEK